MFLRTCWRQAATATGAGLPPAISDDLVRLQYTRIAAVVPILYFAIALIAVISGTSSRDESQLKYHVLLPAAFVLVGLYRCLVWYRRRSMALDTRRMKNYLRSTTVIAFALASAGGLWTIDAYNETLASRRVLAPVFIFMITFAGAICLTCLPRAAIGVMIAALAPPLFVMTLSGDPAIRAMALCFTIVSLLIIALIVSNFREIVKGLELRHELKTLSETDALTGLANRRAFIARFKALTTGQHHGAPVAIVMIDLDGFKQANDRFGHAAGDAILVEAGKRLSGLFPNAASVARLGGDEFALLLEPHAGARHHAVLKEAICSVLSLPYHYRGQRITISASVGIAHSADCEPGLSSLMRHADGDLYRAKRGVPAMRLS